MMAAREIGEEIVMAMMPDPLFPPLAHTSM